MKKLIVLFVLAVAATGSALAQSSYVFVDSEAIFKSLDDYNAAIKQLDDLASGSAEPGVAAVSFRPLRRGGRFRGVCLPSRGYRL